MEDKLKKKSKQSAIQSLLARVNKAILESFGKDEEEKKEKPKEEAK